MPLHQLRGALVKPCPTCGEGVAMRGFISLRLKDGDLGGFDECQHPSHAAAQKVVEAAAFFELEAERLDDMDALNEAENNEAAAVRALLELLEEA